jgi:hypothetical protein
MQFAAGLDAQAKAWNYFRDNPKDKATADPLARRTRLLKNAKADPYIPGGLNRSTFCNYSANY